MCWGERSGCGRSRFFENPRSSVLRFSGAANSTVRSWLAACVRAFTAEWRATRRARIISTMPSAVLGSLVAALVCTARAAASTSAVSCFPNLRLC